MDWKDKVVWITGASSGIGEELVCQLAEKGARIILSARNEEKLKVVKNKAGLSDENSMILPMDVSDYQSMPEFADKVLKSFGQVDVLINNAGVSQRALTSDTDLKVDESLMRVNYFGTVALTKALLPHFIERRSGIIAVTSSVAGKIGTPLRSAYCASKYALHGFFESLRTEVHQYGIQITLAVPGFIKTDISSNAMTGDGNLYGKSDEGQAKGLTARQCCTSYIKAIERGQAEIVISGYKEKIGVLMSRFFPGVLRRMIRKMKVT